MDHEIKNCGFFRKDLNPFCWGTKAAKMRTIYGLCQAEWNTIGMSFKVHIFWEGHKLLQNFHFRFFVLCRNGQIYDGYFPKFPALLRIYELFKDHISALYFLLPGSGSALLPHNAYLALCYFLEYITCTKIISEISRTHCVDVVGVQKRIKWQQSMDLVQLKTFPENWDSKAPSVGTLFAY